jgi:hypothetical protein
VTASFRSTAETLAETVEVPVPRRRDDPPLPTIAAQELLAAWAVVGLIALGILVVQPGGSHLDPSALATTAAASGSGASAAALDGFENAADRAATLAGTEADPVAAGQADEPAPPPASFASAQRWHVRVCHWIAGSGPGAHRGS